MSIPYFQVDAFTSRLFSGNPAGVCLLADWLPDPVLQSIAMENNLAETAFIVQQEGSFRLRWFSPTMEIDLCGHATLAAAHVVFQHMGYRAAMVNFETRAGELNVARDGQLLTLDFPARPAVSCPIPEALTDGLGVTPAGAARSRDFMAVLRTEQEVRAVVPNLDALMELDCLGIIVTAPGENCDFVSRFFAPRAGLAEDPVTGSAHCTLIPYWAQRLGRSRLHAMQLSHRGGELFCECRGERVGIAGKAVTYSTGYLHVM